MEVSQLGDCNSFYGNLLVPSEWFGTGLLLHLLPQDVQITNEDTWFDRENAHEQQGIMVCILHVSYGLNDVTSTSRVCVLPRAHSSHGERREPLLGHLVAWTCF